MIFPCIYFISTCVFTWCWIHGIERLGLTGGIVIIIYNKV